MLFNQPPLDVALKRFYHWMDQCSYFDMMKVVPSNINGFENAAIICTWSCRDLKFGLPKEATEKYLPYRDSLKRWIDMQDLVKVSYSAVSNRMDDAIVEYFRSVCYR